MKDVSYKLRKAYFALLNTVLDVNVYDETATQDAGNYVILSAQNSAISHTKDTFETEASIVIDVVTRFKGNVGTKKTCDEIANAILEAVMPTPSTIGLTVDGFRVVSLEVSTQTLSAQFGDEFIIRKLLTFNHILV